jgi:hypothetical protein
MASRWTPGQVEAVVRSNEKFLARSYWIPCRMRLAVYILKLFDGFYEIRFFGGDL